VETLNISAEDGIQAAGAAAFEWALTTDWANVSISAADAIGALHKIKRDIRRDKKRLFLIARNLHGKGGDPDRFGFIETFTQISLPRGQHKKHFFACQANHHKVSFSAISAGCKK